MGKIELSAKETTARALVACRLRASSNTRSYSLRSMRILGVGTDALPDAVLGQPYDRQLDFGGGTSPYTVSIVSGGLPPGITISTSGRISGTSNVTTTSSFTIRVADSDLVTIDRSMSLRVGSSPAPFVEKVKFTGTKLQITGLFLDAGATVTVNGMPTTKAPKYKPSRAMIVVNGSAKSLNLRRDGTDVIVVTIGGLPSNAFTF